MLLQDGHCTRLRGYRASAHHRSETCPVRTRDLGEEPAARLHTSLLALEIHVHDPERHRVAAVPLEIVEQRPDEEPAQVHALVVGVHGGLDVRAEKLDALRIRHVLPVHGIRVLEGGAAFGDVDRNAFIPFVQRDRSGHAPGRISHPMMCGPRRVTLRAEGQRLRISPTNTRV